MRTMFTLLAVTCLVAGCSQQQSTTETAATDTGTSQPAADAASESTAEPAETLAVAEASAPEETTAVSEGSSLLVIDVRTQEEWDAGHLDIATHIPLDQITDRIGEVAPDKDQKIYLHCRSGGRSGQAKTKLEGLGYTNVENAGGLEEARAQFASGE